MDKKKLVMLGGYLGILTAVCMTVKKRIDKMQEQDVIDISPEQVAEEPVRQMK